MSPASIRESSKRSSTRSPRTPTWVRTSRFHQLVAGEDAARMSGEVGEQVELALGQRNLFSVERGPPRRRLHPQRPVLDRRCPFVLVGGRRDPAHHRLDPGDQLGR